ncbi:hypothetical protein MNBD_DELTA01-1914 [hydrothermal vent metagenome]|uniref:HEPN AbiJ-N-terminal domain-containing protein n=1 Tax=hydrothermal vent metagenome TaxID=652676 RepID=A0A3B0QZD1_9ZZZZ
MAKFSDRMGITTPPTELQVESINGDLHNSLWNLLTISFALRWQELLESLYLFYYKLPIDSMPKYEDECCQILRDKFFKASWDEVYNLIEYILQNINGLTDKKWSQAEFEALLNRFLERELSGWRAIKGEIVPITDKHEVESIREAASESPSGLEGVSTQIKNALHLLGKKPEPDYRNSIKESISAVEGICKMLTGERSGGLDNAMKKLSEKMHLHPSLKLGFLKLYGYTSDEGGIRHSILEEKEIGFAEAKYMLVTCSAFVNFVKDKAHKEGLL